MRTASAGNIKYLVEDSVFSCCTCSFMNYKTLFCISIVRDMCWLEFWFSICRMVSNAKNTFPWCDTTWCYTIWQIGVLCILIWHNATYSLYLIWAYVFMYHTHSSFVRVGEAYIHTYMGSSTEIATIKWYALFSSTELVGKIFFSWF